MTRDEFDTLSGLFAKAPRGLLLEIGQQLEMTLDPERRAPDRWVASVGFGPTDDSLERVEAETYEAVLAKAITHAIDRRLDRIRRARAEVDRVTDRVTWDPLVFMLEKLILQATLPTPQGSSLPHRDTKTGEQTP